MSGITKGLKNESPILSRESIKELVTPQLGDLSHGILWETSENYIGHSGDILGATTYAYYNFNKEIGYILFCNTAGTKTMYKETDKIKSKLKEYYDRLSN